MRTLHKFHGKHFLGMDFCLVVAAMAGIAGYAWGANGATEINGLLDGVRPRLYASIGTSAIGMFGFVFAGVSIISFVTSQSQMKVLRIDDSVKSIWPACFQCLIALAGTGTLAFAALIADTDKNPIAELVIALLFFILMSAARLFRVVWIAWLMVHLEVAAGQAQDRIDRENAEAARSRGGSP